MPRPATTHQTDDASLANASSEFDTETAEPRFDERSCSPFLVGELRTGVDCAAVGDDLARY